MCHPTFALASTIINLAHKIVRGLLSGRWVGKALIPIACFALAIRDSIPRIRILSYNIDVLISY